VRICRVRFVRKTKNTNLLQGYTKKVIFGVTVIFGFFWCFDQSDLFCKYILYLQNKKLDVRYYIIQLWQPLMWRDYGNLQYLSLTWDRIFKNARQHSNIETHIIQSFYFYDWILRIILSNHFFMHIIAVAIFSLQVFENLIRCLENSIEFSRITN